MLSRDQPKPKASTDNANQNLDYFGLIDNKKPNIIIVLFYIVLN